MPVLAGLDLAAIIAGAVSFFQILITVVEVFGTIWAIVSGFII